MFKENMYLHFIIYIISVLHTGDKGQFAKGLATRTDGPTDKVDQ